MIPCLIMFKHTAVPNACCIYQFVNTLFVIKHKGYFAKSIMNRSCKYLRLHNMDIKGSQCYIITEHKLPGIVRPDRMPPLHRGSLTATCLFINSCRHGGKNIHIYIYIYNCKYYDHDFKPDSPDYKIIKYFLNFCSPVTECLHSNTSNYQAIFIWYTRTK